ncbi:MAG: protein translocase subunit SecD [Leptonema illini]|jgi:preprotein translocase subunit SecD|uniref:Protein translocase subunit SecD n=1 Tax=Leptonema illini TaxID=183 RepID=A0A833GZC5_9LEPT|nr:MAG: protein translocase subunit SecD [Leptonema illini]PKL34233.1 MAG: protein translocase subunit SecD [Spirochaetae bacterium HGW-Spirochaetae-10]
MNKLIWKTIVVGLSVGLSALLLWPNYGEREVRITFLEYTRNAEGQREPLPVEKIRMFLADSEKGLPASFPGATCEGQPEAQRQCIVKARYVTATQINEMVQRNADVLDDRRTIVLPHPVEHFFGFLSKQGIKRLSLKLGLDLQGGMRAVFQADYDTYLGNLKERLDPVVKDLEQKLASGTLPEDERLSAENRLAENRRMLELSDARKMELLQEALRIIEKRLMNQNLTEPELRMQPGSYSIAVDLPGVANSTQVLDIIKDTVTVEYRIVNVDATSRFNGLEFQEILLKIQNVYRQEHPDFAEAKRLLNEAAELAQLKPEEGRLFLFWRKNEAGTGVSLPREFRVLGPVVMDGSDMTDARETLTGKSAFYSINFVLSSEGAEKFAEITRNNLSKPMAIVWGDRVVSDPVIQTPIVGGSGIITGSFDLAEASEVATVIREGALPLPLDVLSVSFIGPSLGKQSIEMGVYSVVVGFILVNAFMLLYYRVAGIVAVIALFLNLVILSALLSLLEFTLTLPGFAGLILTVGMAVDANVIIFEKIREDLRAGKSMGVAIHSGFESSFWTILDANVTTLITAVILYYNGDGPIQGFALTLFFGLVSSMFTALFVSRYLFDLMIDGLGMRNVPIGAGIAEKLK